jgi:hypothetical protein
MTEPGIWPSATGRTPHFAARGTLGSRCCDGCLPWHTLFVVRPFVAEVALLTTGPYVRSRTDRRCAALLADPMAAQTMPPA